MDSRTKRFLITTIILAIIGGLGATWVNLYPDFLWFKVVDYFSVYIKILQTKIFVGVIVGICYLAILLINLALIYRFTPEHLSPAFMGGADFTGASTNNPGDTRKMIYGVLMLLAVLFSILMGYTASDRWEIYLRYTNAEDLTFRAATPIIVEESLNTTEIPVSQLELQAKNIRVGDQINLQVNGTNQDATIEAVLDNAIRLNTAVQIEPGQKAFFTSPARDPIFDKDISYYVFKMPVERYICGTLFGIFMLVTIFAIVIYFFHGLITGDTSQFRFSPPFNVKAHLFTLAGITLLLRAWNYQFAMFDLLYATNDVVRGGGGYAAMKARLPILYIMMALTVLCAIVFIISIFLKRNTFAFGGLAVFIVAGILGQVYPVAIQRWQVEPRKQVLEADYINYNIKATLQAYGLAGNTVTEEEYPLTEQLSYDDIRSPGKRSCF